MSSVFFQGQQELDEFSVFQGQRKELDEFSVFQGQQKELDEFSVFNLFLRLTVPPGIQVKGGRWVKTRKEDELRCQRVMQDFDDMQEFSDGAGDENDVYDNTPNVAALRCQLAVCSSEMNESEARGGPIL